MSGRSKSAPSRHKPESGVWHVIRRVLLFFVATISMTVLYYAIFALVFSTDAERKLELENDMYERELAVLGQKERLLSDVIDGLAARDDKIYGEIFHAPAPNVDPFSSLDFLAGIDSVPDDNLVRNVAMRLTALENDAASIEEDFLHVMSVISDSAFVLPPMSSPIGKFTFAQTGASVGDKINPFYKISMRHDGLDMIASSGTPVYASADGTVTEVIRSRKGHGNVVVIAHDGGYVTKYAHLADVVAVKGRRVRKGTLLGNVGMSGNSFAPHLHYEVWRDSLVLDPVDCLFASVTPDEYVNMLVMSASVGQSMD